MIELWLEAFLVATEAAITFMRRCKATLIHIKKIIVIAKVNLLLIEIKIRTNGIKRKRIGQL